MKQTFTSAATSINSGRLPAIYRKVKLAPESIVFDYGCGRYTDHIRAALPAGATYLPYDPYNQPATQNARTRHHIRHAQQHRHPITIICSNVLNVIDSDEIISCIALDLMTIVENSGGAVHVTVYEGDRSGTGRQTGPDQYQRNQPLRDYLRFFPGAVIERGMIVYRPEARQ